MKKKLVAVILLMTLLIITSACSPSTESAPAAPPITFISPANGQTVPLADLTLEVSPVEGAEGYAWTLSQYGAVLWDSFDSGQELTGPKYEIPTQSGLAQRAVAGTMTIQVRARVGGKWSETAEVAIIVSIPGLTKSADDTIAPQPSATPNPVALAQQQNNIYFTGGGTLYWLDPENQKVAQILPGTELIQGLVIDPNSQSIYMNSWDWLWQLPLTQLNEQQEKKLLPLPNPNFGGQGMGIDFQENRIFLGLYYNGLVTRTMDNDNWIQIVSPQDIAPLLGQRGELKLDPTRKHVYFRTAFNGDCDACRWIYRVDYDGRNLTKIVQANGGDALALDLENNKLYYTDTPGNCTIKRANLDGSNVESLLTISDKKYNHCWRMEIDRQAGKLYLSMEDEDYANHQTIARVNLDGSGFEILYQATYDNDPQGSLVILPGQPVVASPGEMATTIIPTQLLSPTPSSPNCAAGWSRLQVGDEAVVMPGDPNLVRSEPQKTDNMIGKLYAGDRFTIIGGPECADGVVFWLVSSPSIPGSYGWTAEGDGKEYWLEPVK